MWTKSKIQLIAESIEVMKDYREGLENLMDNYMIEDSVFIYNNGMVHEATQGYFVEISKHDNLMDAIRTCNSDFISKGIRVIENKMFVVGHIKNNLIECSNENKVFDINRLTDIR